MTDQLPKYHETFVPILKTLSSGDVIQTNLLIKKVQDNFYGHLPQELLSQTTKSGDNLIRNRIAWGKSYLKQAEIISQPSRALVQITEKGRKVLERGTLTIRDILADPDFIANRLTSKEEKDPDEISSESSPQDLIDSGFRAIENQLKIDLLSQLKQTDPFYFQRVVLILLKKMGYGEFVETPKTGDGGIDGIINEDQLGLDRIYVQAKRYGDNKVRETEIRNFIGAMSRDANKGIFVTTSTFDERAAQKARDAQQKIVLIDGDKFIDLMLKHGVGVQVKSAYEVKEIDEDFFDGGS